MIKRLIGRLIFVTIKAAGRCLAAYIMKEVIKRSNEIMLTMDNGKGEKVSFWGAIGQIALAGIASYGMTKMGDEDNTSWVPYRNQMAANMAAASFNFLGQQMQAQATTEQQTTETAAQ